MHRRKQQLMEVVDGSQVIELQQMAVKVPQLENKLK
jgi:hypothetical protein